MKMTKIEALNIAINNLNDIMAADSTMEPRGDEALDVLRKMVEQLSKPRATSEDVKAARREKTKAERAKVLTPVLPVLRDALAAAGEPLTAKALYAACADSLPQDFTVGKVQHILLHEMADEVVKVETKGEANKYGLPQE